ncbi:hypothetical protein TNCV_2840001 [Trichonephila clavipes]|uniref:Uncharacterized protein n=1 Tax=Trichonephila clavipes TaxID=2585209 RepID=A0A8X6RVY5_TRICX|nr:hypothetical protein TNCV_2840001 [Trichonephila clavipes]
MTQLTFLAKEGVTENLMSRRTLTFSEIFSKNEIFDSRTMEDSRLTPGQKIYENCTKCNLVQATPDHLLFCAGLERRTSIPVLFGVRFPRTLGLMGSIQPLRLDRRN